LRRLSPDTARSSSEALHGRFNAALFCLRVDYATDGFHYLLKAIGSNGETTTLPSEGSPRLLTAEPATASVSEVLRFEHEIPDEGLVLEVGVVLGGAPVLALLCLHVGAVLRGAGYPQVVGHDDRPGV